MKKFVRPSLLILAAPVLLTGCITINQDPVAQPQPSVTTVVATPEATQTTQAAPSPSETPVQAIQPPAPASEPAPAGVAPGTSCGLSNTGASTLVVAENATNITCDQVQSIFAEFNATFTSGDTSNYQIQGFTCHTRSQKDVSYESRSVTCKQGGTRLEAMTKYPLGGIPVEDVYSYRMSPSGEISHWFSTDLGICTFTAGAKAGELDCDRTNGNPVSITLRTDTDGPIVRDQIYIYGSESQIKPLPPGHSITILGHTCINNGSSLTCQSSRGGFTLDATSYSTF